MICKYVITFLLLVNLIRCQDKCRILALNGGGDKGAYQAGAIYGLVNTLEADDVKWDVVSGISIGALNALMLSVHEIGKEKEAADRLLKEWRRIEGNNTIYKGWAFGGFLRGLFFESGLFTTSPGFDFLRDVLKDFGGLKRDYTIGAVKIKNGDFVTFRNSQLKTTEDLVNTAMCSAAFPVVFPFVVHENEYYTDGGVKYGTDIPSAVHICKEKGFQHKDIILDVVILSSAKLDEVEPSKLTPIASLMRYLAIDSFTKTLIALEDVEHFLRDIKLRYVVIPSKTLPSQLFPLQFNPQQIEDMINLGISDAKTVVGLGEGVNYKNLQRKRREEKIARFYRGARMEVVDSRDNQAHNYQNNSLKYKQ